MQSILLLPLMFLCFSCQNEGTETSQQPTEIPKFIAEKQVPKEYTKTQAEIDVPATSDNCAEIIIDIVNSSDKVKQEKAKIKEGGAAPSMLLEGDPASNEDNYYDFKLGVNGELRFETILNLRFDAISKKLYEIDWLTGEEKELKYDKALIIDFPEECL